MDQNSECWAYRRDHCRKMKIVDMHLLRWMSEHTLKVKIQNEYVRKVH